MYNYSYNVNKIEDDTQLCGAPVFVVEYSLFPSCYPLLSVSKEVINPDIVYEHYDHIFLFAVLLFAQYANCNMSMNGDMQQ